MNNQKLELDRQGFVRGNDAYLHSGKHYLPIAHFVSHQPHAVNDLAKAGYTEAKGWRVPEDGYYNLPGSPDVGDSVKHIPAWAADPLAVFSHFESVALVNDDGRVIYLLRYCDETGDDNFIITSREQIDAQRAEEFGTDSRESLDVYWAKYTDSKFDDALRVWDSGQVFRFDTTELARARTIATLIRGGMKPYDAFEAADVDDSYDMLSDIFDLGDSSEITESDLRDLWLLISDCTHAHERFMLYIYNHECLPQDVREEIEADSNFNAALIYEDGDIFDPFYRGDRTHGAELRARVIEVRKSGRKVLTLDEYLKDGVEEFDVYCHESFYDTATPTGIPDELPVFVVNGIIRAWKGVDVGYPYMETMAKEYEEARNTPL